MFEGFRFSIFDFDLSAIGNRQSTIDNRRSAFAFKKMVA